MERPELPRLRVWHFLETIIVFVDIGGISLRDSCILDLMTHLGVVDLDLMIVSPMILGVRVVPRELSKTVVHQILLEMSNYNISNTSGIVFRQWKPVTLVSVGIIGETVPSSDICDSEKRSFQVQWVPWGRCHLLVPHHV